jgi:hypothetical protein
VGVAQLLAQHDTVAGVCLDGETKQRTCLKQRYSLPHNGCEIAHVRQDVGSEDEVIARRRSAVGGHERADLRRLETIVQTFWRAFAIIAGDRSTPTNQSQTGRIAAPASPVPQPRSSTVPNRDRRPRRAQWSVIAASSNAGAR